MGQETATFMQAEQGAQELVEALKGLQKEMKSYKQASSELESAREKLSEFVDKSQKIAEDTHAVVNLIKEIGGPQIIDSIQSSTKAISKQIDASRQAIMDGIATALKPLALIRMLAIAALVVSTLALAVGIFGLVK